MYGSNSSANDIVDDIVDDIGGIDGAAGSRDSPRLPIVQTMEDVSLIMNEALELMLSDTEMSRTDSHGVRWSVSLFRTLFFSISTMELQRKIFFRIAAASKPKLATLIGAPPFFFLKDGEAHMINATGLSKGRVNMTCPHRNGIPGYTQFGAPVATDGSGLQYSICTQGHRDGQLHPLAYFDGETVGTFDLYIRIPRQRRAGRAPGLQLTFPNRGGVVHLHPTTRLMSLFPEGMLSTIRVRVKAIRSTSPTASTACIQVETL